MAVEDFLNKLEHKSRARSGRPGVNPGKMELLDKILPGVASKLGLEKRLREHALMQSWTSFLPLSLSEASRPLFIDSRQHLVVAVADAAVAQEITLMKNQILKPIRKLAATLGIEIAGLRIDLKNFFKQEAAEFPEAEKPLPLLNEEELAHLDLSQDDKRLIDNLAAEFGKDSNLPDEQIKKLLSAYEQQLKLFAWRRKHGYQSCQLCQSPVLRLYEHASNKLCFNCLNQAKI